MSRQKKLLNNNSGFTLLETMIALAIMVVAFASIIAVESNSINASIKAKQMNAVAMLARNVMIETEYKVEGKTFDEMKKEESGIFDSPYQDYRWKTEIKEIEFPSFNMGSQGSAATSGAGDIADLMTKLITSYLSKAVREITVTVYWKRGKGEQNFSVSTYWVNLNNEFSLSE